MKTSSHAILIPKLRHFLLSACLVVALSGCASNSLRPVWTQANSVPRTLAAPAGFRITPKRAYAIAHTAARPTRSHAWYFYADSQYYYVHDTVLGVAPWRVHAFGVRVDGRTGKIHPR